MRSAPQEYQEAYTHGGLYIAKVEILNATGALIRNSDTLEVVGGTVHVDRSASFRRSVMDLTFVDTDGTVIPNDPDDLFNVTSGNEVKIYAGYRVDSSDYFFSQGVFGLEGADTVDSLDGIQVTLSAHDRGRKISRNKTYRPYVIANNSNAVSSVTTLLQNRYPGLVVIAQPSDFTIPYTLLDPDRDPWEAALEIMEDIGYELFMNTDGAAVMQPEPNPDDPGLLLAATYQEGLNATTMKITRASSNEDVPNFIVLDGENSYNITPPRGLAWDDVETSPTYAGDPTANPPVPPGDYGLVTRFVKKKKVTNSSQAIAAAQAELFRSKNTTEMASFSIVPNPAHEEVDLIRLVRAATGMDARLLVERMEIPLTSEGAPDMLITTRQRSI